MYRHLDDFEQDWIAENAATVKLLHALTDDALDQRVDPDGRTLGDIAWHIVSTISEMLRRVDIPVELPLRELPTPTTAAEIVAVYEAAARTALAAVRANWTDASLLDEVDMYGETWTKGFTLKALLAHEVHHRGQMTVLMRQAGLPVPGVYGPSREEWAAYGMAPMP